MVNLKSSGDCDFCFESAHLLSNLITLAGGGGGGGLDRGDGEDEGGVGK